VSSDNVTSINAAYLRGLVDTFLQPLLDEVGVLLSNGQIQNIPGLGNKEVFAIDGTLTVPAGNVNAFPPAAALVKALGKVGSSVNADLTWFQTALQDTIDEINTTISTLKGADDINAEQASVIEQDFAGAIAAVSSSPTGGSGSSSSGSSGT
jgi:hypothetical protein